MSDIARVVEEIALAHEYDPVKAREYYLRTRKLKGRKVGSAAKPINPQSRIGYNGKPLKKLGSRMEEDETPNTSPSGAKLVDYDGKGLGKATYSDGSVYDAAVGWKQGGRAAVTSAKAANNAQRAKSGMNPRRRIGQAEQKLIRAKTLANRVKDPVTKAALLNRLAATERKLKSVKAKQTPVKRNRGVE